MPGVYFANSHSLWVAIPLLGLGLGLLVWSYRTTPAGATGWICLGLKTLGIAALAACLLEPMRTAERARPGANVVAIVSDNSQSLQVRDNGAAQTRGEVLRALLDTQRGGWQKSLEENFEVRRYFFDARLQTTRDFSELAFDGRGSAIGLSLRTLAERYQGRPLTAVLLLTDGNATDMGAATDLAGLPPVYPVVIGGAQPARDLAVQEVHTTQTDFEDAPVSIQADVSATRYRGQSVVAQLLDASAKPVMEQELTAKTDNDLLAFRFHLRPDKAGLSFYRLQVRAKSEANSPVDQKTTQEATLANNQADLVVDRGSGPHRILYVSGRPNWEFKFLNRAVQEDDQLDLVALIRVARREPKFNFLGRVGEASNPLFRGFGNQSPDEVESYDQPVLVRLNTRDEFELRGGFPKTAEELYGFQAVILDHVEADFFTADQAALLQRFVSERGGGLIMLGGMESFQQGQYQHTPIGDMLPVYLERVENTNPPGPLRLALTREGWLQPWARVRDNEADEEERLREMAPFQVINRVREVKPGASVISTATDGEGQVWPALVVQRFGRGRTAALTIGDYWHWGFRDEAAHRDLDKAWRQLMRWLVNDVPKRVELTAEPRADDPNGAVTLHVRVRDPKFQPLDNAAIALNVQPVMVEGGAAAQTNTVRLQAEPSASEPGLYEAVYVPRLTGGYRAAVSVTNSAGVGVGTAETGWSTDLAAKEFASLSPNVSLLQSIARKTGGEIVPAVKLDEFARALPHRRAPVMEGWSYPLWHSPAVFGFALACLVSEWGLRRWKGLA